MKMHLIFKQCEELTNINIKGIMLMGPNVDDKEKKSI